MRLFAPPLVALALSGCFISDAEYQDAVDGLSETDTDPADTDVDSDTDSDTDSDSDTDVPPPLDFSVASVSPELLNACDTDAKLHVEAEVNGGWEGTSFGVKARFDGTTDWADAGTAVADDAFAGKSTLAFDATVDAPDTACAQASCERTLTVGIDGPGTADATADTTLLVVPPSSGPAFVSAALVDADGALVPWDADTTLLDNPADALLIDDYPAVRIGISDPWLAAGGPVNGFSFTVRACPEGATTGCEDLAAVVAAQGLPDADVTVEFETDALALLACGVDPADHRWDFSVVVEGDACAPAKVLAVSEAPVRFVFDDCDMDEMSATGLEPDCDDLDPAVANGPAWFVDTDGDDYGSTTVRHACTLVDGLSNVSGDCNDTVNVVFPGAPETCDNVDSNCKDGETDATDRKSWYADADTDSFGDQSGSPTLACFNPSTTDAAYTLDHTDCNDAKNPIHPGAAELCDSVDNDCDTTVDEDGTNGGPWYIDADGDGFGSTLLTGSAGTACAARPGAVGQNRDCDDSKIAVNPDATEVLEACTDSIDNNCDGRTDEAECGTCTDGVMDVALGETDLNCGGVCDGCASAKMCDTDADCGSSYCSDGGYCDIATWYGTGVGWDRVRDLAFFSNGDLLIVGETGSPSLAFEGQNYTSIRNTDIFMARVRADDSVVWAKRWSMANYQIVRGVAVAPSNDFWIAGGYETGTVFGEEPLLVRFDGAGVQAEVVTPQVGVGNDIFNDVTLSGTDVYAIGAAATQTAGNVLTGGVTSGAIVTYKKGGNVNFIASMDGLAIATGIATLPSTGDLVVSGYFSGTVNFGGSGNILSANGSSFDGFIARINKGSPDATAWVRTLSGTDQDLFFGISALSNDFACAGGTVRSANPPFAASIFVAKDNAIHGEYDAVVACVDASGGSPWADRFGGLGYDIVSGITAASAGQVLLTGTYAANSTAGVELGDNQSVPRVQGDEAFLVRYATTGLQQKATWASSADQWPRVVARASNGAVYVGGDAMGSIDFGDDACPSEANGFAWVAGLGSGDWNSVTLP